MAGDDAPHDIQPEPGPGTDFLGRIERLENMALRLARYPRPVVDHFYYGAPAFHVRPQGDTTASVYGVYGVVDEVGPDLVKFTAAPRYLRQILLVFLPQGDVLQPGAEDGEGVPEAGDHIHLPDRRPVHVGVLLHRPDQLGDTLHARPDLIGQSDEIQGRGEPPQTPGERAIIEYFGQGLQTIHVNAGRRKRRRHIPRLIIAVVLQPTGEFVLRVAQRERVERGGTLGGRFALQGQERLAFSGGETLVVADGGELGLEDRPAEIFGGPPGRGGGVVQLVGESRRELAQGRELLLLAVGALRLAHAPGQAGDEDVGHVRDLDGDAPEGLRVDLQDAARRDGPGPVDGGLPGEHHEPAGELSGPVVHERRLFRAVEARDAHFSLENDVEAVHGGLLVEKEVSGLESRLPAVGHQRLDLLGCEHLLFPRIARGSHHVPASIRRFPATVSSSSGPSTGSLTSKRVSPGSETTWMSPPCRPTTMR